MPPQRAGVWQCPFHAGALLQDLILVLQLRLRVQALEVDVL